MKTRITFDPETITPEEILKLINTCNGQIDVSGNQNDEDMILCVLSDHIETATFQHNHWVRVNEYYPDGTSCEYFDGKW